MCEKEIPPHRHEIKLRSGDGQVIEGGNDDEAAQAPVAKKPAEAAKAAQPRDAGFHDTGE